MSDRAAIVMLAAFVALLLGACAWNYAVWKECRANGSSVPYCVRMIVR